MIETLIDKKDTFEIVRDQICAILKIESEEQKHLAMTTGQNPANWDFRVFQERSRPFEEFQYEGANGTPIVNVWFDNETFEDKASDTVERQKAVALYNIDCYTMGVSQETGEGHTPGDLASTLDSHRIARLVRNILMSGHYTYLGMRKTVWRRRIDSITIFQPGPGEITVQNIMGARIIFRVEFSEMSPQVQGAPLEILSVQVKRTETGEILLNAEYHYDGD